MREVKNDGQSAPLNAPIVKRRTACDGEFNTYAGERDDTALFVLIKTGGEKVAEIRDEYGGCSIERCINFERREGYMENMRVEVKTDAMLSPEKTKEITSIVEKAIGEIRKTVEKW